MPAPKKEVQPQDDMLKELLARVKDLEYMVAQQYYENKAELKKVFEKLIIDPEDIPHLKKNGKK